MRFLADECMDAGLVARLRGAGHDVRYVAEGSRGADDLQVLTVAADERRILLTEDKDFGEYAYRLRAATPGIVLLRLHPVERTLKWVRLLAAIQRFGEALTRQYTVVEEARFRFRSLQG